MSPAMITTVRHLTPEQLEAGLAHVLASPREGGRVELVVRRPAPGEREALDKGVLDARLGLVGDSWLARGNRHTPDGSAVPEMQVTVMNARVAELVADGRDRMPLAGDQLYVDLDLSIDNLPVGTRLAVGDAVLEVTAPPHTGCAKFVDRFGGDAMRFVNSSFGRRHRLRGMNTRVVVPGRVAVGDVVRKVQATPAQVALRSMTRDDLSTLARWLDEPHVRRWWAGDPSGLDAVTAEYGPCIDGAEPTELFVVECDGRAVGMVQRYRVDDYPEWAKALPDSVEVGVAAGLDYLVGEPDAVGRGIGTSAIERMVGLVWERWPDVTTVAVTVQQANRPSWRALERAGFRREWAGMLDSDDPSDAGPAYLYLRER